MSPAPDRPMAWVGSGALLLLLCALLLLVATACSPLRTFNTVLPKDRGSARIARDIAYAAGPRHGLDVYAPAGAARSARLPVIVFFYGGSWNSGDKADYSFVGRALAARGFVVVIPDYRLVPEVRFPAFLEDGAAAVKWVRANVAAYGGDGARIVLAGHSAGAYNAAMLALDERWLGPDRAAVRGLAGIAGPYDFLPLSGPVPLATFGDWPTAAETQPIRFADGGDPPALLLHGAADRLVLPRNSEALAAKLRAAGVAAEARLYPGVAHAGIVTAFAKPLRGRAATLADVAAFARRVTEND